MPGSRPSKGIPQEASPLFWLPPFLALLKKEAGQNEVSSAAKAREGKCLYPWRVRALPQGEALCPDGRRRTKAQPATHRLHEWEKHPPAKSRPRRKTFYTSKQTGPLLFAQGAGSGFRFQICISGSIPVCRGYWAALPSSGFWCVYAAMEAPAKKQSTPSSKIHFAAVRYGHGRRPK